MSKDKNAKLTSPIITEEQLKAVFSAADSKKLKEYCLAMNAVLPLFEIDTPARVAAFLGQIGVESGQLRFTKELPSKYNKKNPKDPKEPTGTLYEGRKNLGNNVAGDGPKYIGRGVLQLTGRANYTEYGKKLGLDLVNNPELAEGAETSIKIAAQYFKDRKILPLADKWDIGMITERVNGKARLHLAERTAFSDKALKILTA